MRRSLRVPTIAGLAAMLSVALLAGPALAATTIVVWPGQSIQAAVNRAHAGDTVLLKPGIYRQSVFIKTDGVSLRGSGAAPGGTVIEPGAGTSSLCAKFASGVCVVGTKPNPVVDNATVRDLMVRNFKGSGVIAFSATGLVVQNVVANNNGEYGIARFETSGGALVTNVTNGNGEAGLYIGDSPHANVFVAGNETSGNQLGILQRHAQHSFIQYNDIHDNCIGMFFVAAPAPVGSGTFSFNSVYNNNKFCKGNPDELPFAHSGGGIVLLGTTGEVVSNNSVLGNRGNTPVSGGIVLINAKPLGGPPSSGNTIQYNTAYHNSPADIVDRSGGKNTFRWNRCDTPAGYCH